MSKQKPVEYKYRIEILVRRFDEYKLAPYEKMVQQTTFQPFNSFDLNDEEVIEILNKIIEIRDRRENQ